MYVKNGKSEFANLLLLGRRLVSQKMARKQFSLHTSLN
jgi:hypothetical protein